MSSVISHAVVNFVDICRICSNRSAKWCGLQSILIILLRYDGIIAAIFILLVFFGHSVYFTPDNLTFGPKNGSPPSTNIVVLILVRVLVVI